MTEVFRVNCYTTEKSEIAVDYPYYRRDLEDTYIDRVERTRVIRVTIEDTPSVSCRSNYRSASADEGGLDYLLGREVYEATEQQFYELVALVFQYLAPKPEISV